MPVPWVARESSAVVMDALLASPAAQMAAGGIHQDEVFEGKKFDFVTVAFGDEQNYHDSEGKHQSVIPARITAWSKGSGDRAAALSMAIRNYLVEPGWPDEFLDDSQPETNMRAKMQSKVFREQKSLRAAGGERIFTVIMQWTFWRTQYQYNP